MEGAYVHIFRENMVRMWMFIHNDRRETWTEEENEQTAKTGRKSRKEGF